LPKCKYILYSIFYQQAVIRGKQPTISIVADLEPCIRKAEEAAANATAQQQDVNGTTSRIEHQFALPYDNPSGGGLKFVPNQWQLLNDDDVRDKTKWD
jgi:hypothetical protein